MDRWKLVRIGRLVAVHAGIVGWMREVQTDRGSGW